MVSSVPDVARSLLRVNLEGKTDQIHSTVRTICLELVPQFKELTDELLEVSQLSGGITNILLVVKPKEEREDRQPVTVRVFGPNTDIVIDRDREWQAIKLLSEAGFGAKLIGSFENGVVQSFIHARTLEPQEMSKPEMVTLIAKAVREFHSVEGPGVKESQLWPTIYKYLELASKLSFDDLAKKELFEKIDFEQIRRDIDELKEESDKLNSPVVFCHNDLLSGNFMYDEKKGKFYIIDYEYGSYSFRGFDLGNHFCEYAGFDCNYKLYPTKKAQYCFYRCYLHPEDPEKATEAELEELYVESNCYALASHLCWGVWGLVQAKYSLIDFDYLGYFFLRYGEYKERKEEFLQLAVEWNKKKSLRK